jgi:hypothetical protein
MREKKLALTGKAMAGKLMKSTLYLPENVHKQARIYCVRHGLTLTEFVLEAVKARLKERPAEEIAGD